MKNNSALWYADSKKQESLKLLVAKAAEERRKRGYRVHGNFIYSSEIRRLARFCRDYGCSCKEISLAIKVTDRTILNWISKIAEPKIRQLNIIPNKITDISLPPNQITNTHIDSDKCEIIFPSGVKMLLDPKFFTNNLIEHLYTKKG